MRIASLIVGAAAMVMTTIPALAVEVDFSTVLKDLDGKPFTDCAKYDSAAQPPKCEQMVDVTLGRLAESALARPEQGLANDELIRRGLLARDIHRQPKQNLTADDVKTIKDLISKIGYSPVLVVAAFEILDPQSVKPRNR